MKRAGTKTLVLIALLIAAIFAFDRMLPAGVLASALFVVPIMLSLRLASPRGLIAVTLVCILSSILDYLLSAEASNLPLIGSNELISLVAQITTASLVYNQMKANMRERENLERAETERRRLALVHSIAETTTSILDLDQVLKTVGESLASLFATDSVVIWLADESGSNLKPAFYDGDEAMLADFRNLSWQSSPLSLAEAIRSRSVVIVTHDSPAPPETLENLRKTGAKMAVIIPLFARERLVGAISLAMSELRQFGEDDRALVETIGKQVATAIENAQLFSNVNRQRERLALVNEIGQALASRLDLETIYLAVYERLGELIECDALLISLYEPETETIRCAFGYADGRIYPSGWFEPIKLGSGPQSECIRRARPLIVDNITTHSPGTYRYVGQSEENPLAILYVPMIVQERVIGVIQAQSVLEGAYTEEDVPLLSIIANQAAAAIQNARLYNDAVEGRRALERANHIKDQFLATLSHELRTPLTPILGWTHLLSKLPPDDHETREQAISVIERNARFQTQLVNDLLDMSRIESGKLALYLQLTDLNAAVRAAVENLRGEARSRSIEIETDLSSDRVMISADPKRLQQIISNLLVNAIKFTDENGRVIISTTRTMQEARLTITDTGIGIEAEFLPHIFERFRQADSSTSRRHGGLGLGLSIVHSLVGMHGGRIRVGSEGQGRGATFTVEIPLAVTAEGGGDKDAPAQEKDEEATSISGLRLLIIEDDLDTIEMMRVLCETKGLRVIEAYGAEQALRMAITEQPDIIISDISMPAMDGYEFARRIRQEPGLSALPMIAVSGLASDEDRDRALDSGFAAHLPKPIDPGSLFALIRELAGKRVVTID